MVLVRCRLGFEISLTLLSTSERHSQACKKDKVKACRKTFDADNQKIFVREVTKKAGKKEGEV